MTLREHLEAIRAIADNKNEVSGAAFYAICDQLDAIRRILDESPERCLGDPNLGQRTHRLVPDPGPS